jgi:hypothetical protein
MSDKGLLNFKENSQGESFLKEAIEGFQEKSGTVHMNEYEVWVESDCYLVDATVDATYENTGTSEENKWGWTINNIVIDSVVKTLPDDNVEIEDLDFLAKIKGELEDDDDFTEKVVEELEKD